ncbi:MAG: class I SAM-dependent methyltransferase [Hyphomicrobiaceae bacterium]
MSGDEAPTPRDIGRAWAHELQASAEKDGNRDRWFEELYQRAGGKPEFIPWETAAPRFKLREWLEQHPGHGLRAIDIGCGLGDNAACLAEAGYDVTAFDLSQTAVQWAGQRFGNDRIAFRHADVFDLPAAWRGAFDLVHETYNLQAMPQERVAEAIGEIASLVRPGGQALIITRGREPDTVPDGPPWPLTRDMLRVFADAGLEEMHFETFGDERSEPIPHFLVTYELPETKN